MVAVNVAGVCLKSSLWLPLGGTALGRGVLTSAGFTTHNQIDGTGNIPYN